MSKILEKEEILTLGFGNQILDGRPYNHTGIDVVGKGYTACHVKPIKKGKVIEAGWNNIGYGYNVVIDHENGYLTRYAHLADNPGVVIGQYVDENTLLGYMGDTGNAKGIHLHFEIISGALGFMPIDPTEYIFGNKELPNAPEPIEPDPIIHKIGELVVYSSCYRDKNDTIGKHIDCIREYGAWQQRNIVEIIEGSLNPYKLDNGMYVNNGDIRFIK